MMFTNKHEGIHMTQQQCELEKAQAQIKELEETIKRIQEEVDKPCKWEPKEGKYHLYGDFAKGPSPSQNYILAGTGSYTEEQAEIVGKELRKTARMWAYKMEFDADFVPDWNDDEQSKYYPQYLGNFNTGGCSNSRLIWGCSNSLLIHKRQGLPYFSKQACEELVEKLNSGEVEF